MITLSTECVSQQMNMMIQSQPFAGIILDMGSANERRLWHSSASTHWPSQYPKWSLLLHVTPSRIQIMPTAKFSLSVRTPLSDIQISYGISFNFFFSICRSYFFYCILALQAKIFTLQRTVNVKGERNDIFILSLVNFLKECTIS